MRLPRLPDSALWLAVAYLAAASLGCSEGYDFEREQPERGTLGEILYGIWHKDAKRARHKPKSKKRMLEGHEEQFVEAVDHMVPPEEYESVDQFLRQAHLSIDSGLLPSLTRKLRISMLLASRDEPLLGALADGAGPSTDSYLAAEARPGLPGYLLGYEEMTSVSLTLGGALLEADGQNAQGRRDADEATAFLDLQRVASSAMKDLTVDPEGDPLALSLQDVLLVEDQRFRAEGESRPLPAVRYDRRGLPAVQTDSTGQIPFPLVDNNDDGLADINDTGEFLLDDGSATHIRPYAESSTDDPFMRDERGRALAHDQLLFDYVDLSGTGLHFTARQTGRIHQKRALWDLIDAMPALLGERTVQEDEFGQYKGYETDQPIADVIYAGLNGLTVETLPEILRSLAQFLDGSDEEMAGMLEAMAEAKETIDEYPDARLIPESTIGYDLLPVVRKIAEDKELWADVMDALAEPVVKHTGEAMGTMIRYRDKETVPLNEGGGGYEQCFQRCRTRYETQATEMHPHGIGLVGRYECIRDCPIDELFRQKTDFDAPEGPDNRSVNQQTFHLLRDTTGTPYNLEITQAKVGPINITTLPPVIELPGAAEAFIATIGGNLDMKDYVSAELTGDSTLGKILDFLGVGSKDISGLLSALSGAFGTHLDRRPTPDQVTRMFNQDDLKIEVAGVTVDVNEPICKDGYKMADHHADKLFASEAAGLIDTLQPLAKAFSDHGKEDLLAQFFVVVHEHYSKRDDLYRTKSGMLTPMKGANFVSMEEPLMEVVDSGKFFKALHAFAVAVDRTKPKTGAPFAERLRQLVYHLTRQDDDFRGRDGSAELRLPDRTLVEEPSRAHFLIDGLGKLNDRLDGHPEAEEKLQDGLAAVSDIFLSFETNDRGNVVFANSGTVAMLSHGSRALADTAEEMRRDDQLEQTVGGEWPEALIGGLDSRTLAALVDLGGAFAETDKRRRVANGLFDHLLDSPAGQDQLAASLYTLFATSVQAEDWVPVANFLGRLIDPARTWGTQQRENLPFLSHLLTLLERLTERDEAGAGFDLLGRGLEARDDGTTAIGTIGGVISDYYRRDPDSTDPYATADYRRVFAKLADWFGDDVHGLEQLYDLIGRRVKPEGSSE